MMIALAVGLLLAGLAGAWQLPEVAKFDLATSRDLQRFRNPWLDASMTGVTWLGAWLTLIPVALLSALWLYRVGRRRESTAALLSLGALPVDTALKLVANRPRPGGVIEVLTATSGSSFPSGHSMGSAAVYGTLAVLLWTLTERKALVGLLLAAPLLVGVSRVYLGAHWGYDVVAGWSAGSLWVAGISAWLRLGTGRAGVGTEP